MNSFFSKILNALLSSNPGLQWLAGSGGGIASNLSDTASTLVAFFSTITDYRMWRSLGWLLLGIVMIAAGIALFAKSTVLSVIR